MLAAHSDDRDGSEPSESWQRVWEAVAVAERAAEQLGHTPRTSPRPSRIGSFGRSAALVAIGITLGGVMTWAGGLSGPPGGDAAAVHGAALDAVYPTGRCDDLLAFCRHAIKSAKCPTCGETAPPARVNAVALCAVCHALPSPAREPTSEGVSAGWLRSGGVVDSVAGPDRT